MLVFLTNSYVVSICCNPDLRRLPAWVVVYILKGVFTKKKKKVLSLFTYFLHFPKHLIFFVLLNRRYFEKMFKILISVAFVLPTIDLVDHGFPLFFRMS